jgi:hypothetical protein
VRSSSARSSGGRLGRLAPAAVERPQQVPPGDDADDGALADDRDAAVVGQGDEPLQLRQRRLLGRGGDAPAHHRLDGGVRELVPDRLVEVLAADDPHRPALLVDDEDAALAVALADRHRASHALLGRDGADGRRHHVARAPRLPQRSRHRFDHQPPRLLERQAGDGRRRALVAAAAERGGQRAGVDPLAAAARDQHDPLLHLDEHDERPAVGQVDQLVGQVADAVDVLRPRDGRDQQLLPAGVHRLDGLLEREQQPALGSRERRVQELEHELLARPVTHAPGERVRVALGRRQVGERAGVLVDPEREDGRLERRRHQLALGEDGHHRRRQRAVAGEHRRLRVDPAGQVVAVVVEDDDLRLAAQRDRLELAQPRGLRRLHDDQAPDRAGLEPGRLHQLELVGVQPHEVADVAVERPGQRDDRAGVEPARGELRRERVEVGVPVRGDHGLGAHPAHSAPGRHGPARRPR